MGLRCDFVMRKVKYGPEKQCILCLHSFNAINMPPRAYIMLTPPGGHSIRSCQ
jgi:hypothetical protein